MLGGILQTLDDLPLDCGTHCGVGGVTEVLSSSFQCILLETEQISEPHLETLNNWIIVQFQILRLGSTRGLRVEKEMHPRLLI